MLFSVKLLCLLLQVLTMFNTAKSVVGDHMTGDSCLLHVYRCEIATREYCDFMHGYFHEEATLCSQVTHTAFEFSSVNNCDVDVLSANRLS